MAEFAPLFPLETQFQAKDGRNNTAGWLKVFLAGTDDPAVTYSDYSGTRNPEKIVLDNNGRAIIICDKEQGYRLEVYDARGMLLWTEEPVFCSGTGGAGMAMTEIVSTDGSIDVQKNTAGGVTQFDIGLAPNDSDEFLEWGKGFCSSMYSGTTKIPLYSAGTITFDDHGAKLYKDRFYHITNRFEVKPTGNGIQYETFMAAVKLYNPEDGTSAGVYSGQWNIDTSVSDVVILEFSFDLVPAYDGELYWDFANTLQLFQYTHAYMQIHRVYSGINAVPDTCATKQWVSSNYIPQSASSNFQTKSGMSAYVPYSAVEGSGSSITGINGSAISGMVDSSQFMPASASGLFYPYSGNPSGFLTSHQDISTKLDVTAFTSYSANLDSALGDEFNQISSAFDDVQSALDDKLDKSASGDFYPMTGNPSGFLTSVDLTPYQTTAGMTAYSYNSSLSSKQDASAMSAYYPISNPSGFITGVDLSDYATTAQLADKLDNSAFTSYTATALTSLESAVSSMSSTVSGLTGAYLEQSASSLFAPSSVTTSKQDASAMSAYQTVDGMSAYYPASNPSGFITGVDLSDYATTAYVDSSVSGKADTSALTAYAYESSNSAKLDKSAQIVTALGDDGTYITSINGSSISGIGGEATGDYVEKSSLNVTIGDATNYATVTSVAMGVHSLAKDYSVSFGLSGEAYASSFAIGAVNKATDRSIAAGSLNSAYRDSMAVGLTNDASYEGVALGGSNLAYDTSMSVGFANSASSIGIALGHSNLAYDTSMAMGISNTASAQSFTIGSHTVAYNSATAFGTYNIAADGNTDTGNSAAFVIGDGTATGARHNLMLVTKDGEITMYSSTADTVGTGIMSSLRAISASGGVDSATVSAIASSYAESAVSGKQDSSAMTAYQEVSGMTAYQPSGDYIYVSALGWAEV